MKAILLAAFFFFSVNLQAGIGSGESSEGATPVELTTFSVSISNNTIILVWTTATEVNNFGFEVQKSISTNQSSDFKKIGFVEGHGNSNSPKNYSFIDNQYHRGKVFYRLKQIDTNGKIKYSSIIELNNGTIINKYVLMQNFPNPFNPTTVITYSIPKASFVTVDVFDIQGKKIVELVNKRQDEGSYKIIFDAASISSGVYFCRMNASSLNGSAQKFNDVKKMLLLK